MSSDYSKNILLNPPTNFVENNSKYNFGMDESDKTF